MPTADEISGTDELVTAILAMADAAKNETPLLSIAIAYAEMAFLCEQSEEVALLIIKKTLKRVYDIDREESRTDEASFEHDQTVSR